MKNFTDEELEILQRCIDDSDWDISQRNDVWELLPRLLMFVRTVNNFMDTFEQAYAIDLFPELSKEQREKVRRAYPGVIDRTAAGQGRHMIKVLRDKLAAADEREAV